MDPPAVVSLSSVTIIFIKIFVFRKVIWKLNVVSFLCFLLDRIVTTRSGVLSKNVMIKTYKNNTFVCCFIWMWNLVSYSTEEHRLRLFVGSVVRRIFWSKETVVEIGWGKVYNKDLHNFTIHWLLIRQYTETGYVARTRQMTNAYVLVGKAQTKS